MESNYTITAVWNSVNICRNLNTDSRLVGTAI